MWRRVGGTSSVCVCLRWLLRWLTHCDCLFFSENHQKEIIFNLPSSQVRSRPGYQVSERAHGSAHQLTSLTCPGVAAAWPLSAQAQIQTYQVLQEHLAPSTSTAASGLGNQRKPMEDRRGNPISCFFITLLPWAFRLLSIFALIWSQTNPCSSSITRPWS